MSPGASTARQRRRRNWVTLAAVVAVVVGGVLAVGPPPTERPPLDPASSGPLGTKALVLLLGDLGADVGMGDAPPSISDDVALVLDDQLDDTTRDRVEQWVVAGGTLVVADPASPLQPFAVDAPTGLPFVEAPFDASCAVPALAAVEEVSPPSGSVGYTNIPDTEGCFRRNGAAFVGLRARGSGTVVSVGGAGLFTNQAIGDPGNAVLAAVLLAPRGGTGVHLIGSSGPGGGQETLSDLVGDNVKAALLQIGLAFAAYLAWRARRLGSPVTEPMPVALASSELVVAVGHLLQQAGHHDEAARLVSQDLCRRLAVRLGLGRDASVQAVAEMVATRSGLPLERVRSIIAPPPLAGPEALVAHVAATEALHQEVVHV